MQLKFQPIFSAQATRFCPEHTEQQRTTTLFFTSRKGIYIQSKNLEIAQFFGLTVRPTTSTGSRAEFLPSDKPRLPDIIATAECFSHHSLSSAALHQFLFSPRLHKRQCPISEERHCSGQTNFPRSTGHRPSVFSSSAVVVVVVAAGSKRNRKRNRKRKQRRHQCRLSQSSPLRRK